MKQIERTEELHSNFVSFDRLMMRRISIASAADGIPNLPYAEPVEARAMPIGCARENA
jgi:hypothetical protein